jgi:hypothetical protein
MLERYNASNFKKAIKDPHLIWRELLTLSQYNRIHKYKFERRYGKEELITDKEWDFLILLDACRYDIFEEINTIEGDLEKCISAGSHSKEFAEKNFQGAELYDTVYITANAHGARIGEGNFHDIVFTERNDTGSWATRNGMHPKNVAESAIKAYNKYPNKKMIVHFMQPHSPYFGEKAQNIRSSLSKNGINDLGSNQWEIGPNLKVAVKKGHISISELNTIYKENLKLVLDYAQTLVNKFEGKIVISADHGELLGKRTGIWKYTDFSRQTPSGTPVGHPKSVYLPELREVPWLIIDSGSRRKIINQSPNEQRVEDRLIEERLSKLGYK